jgi:DNA-binding transcriptional MerR regulator
VDITEVARRSGVRASTLRFYEEKGLIASIGRRGLHRVFDPGILERLALIVLGRSAGFALDEIALMFAADGRPASTGGCWRPKRRNWTGPFVN